MLSEVFGHLVKQQGVLSKAQHVLEWTRYFIVKERRIGRTDCRLLAAFQQFCLEEGITEVTAVVEMWWLPRWHQAGFKVRPLGLPTMIEGQPCIAAPIRDFAAKPGPCPRPRRTARFLPLRNAPLRRPLNRVPHVAA